MLPRVLLLLAAVLTTSAAAGSATVVARSGLKGGRFVAPIEAQLRDSALRSNKIEHVIWIMQENRSFDNLFQGYPGADTVASGQTSTGKTVTLRPITLATSWDIDHSSAAFFTACDGNPPGRNCKMDGFNREENRGTGQYPTYAYVPHPQVRPYFDMARHYVLADRTFTSHLDASYISHQYMIAGQADRAVDFPTAAWGCTQRTNTIKTLTNKRSFGHSIDTCRNYETLGDELDAAGISWRLYAAGKHSYWVAYRSIRHIVDGPDWTNDVVGSSAQVLRDVANGSLASMTWVTPTCANSDHASCQSDTGPDWVASVVNAVGESKFWESTVIFVMWDEWGGWYDHVPPPYVDFDGLGMRVPLLVISPYAKRGYVSHVQYEHGSLLRFIEDEFGLARLAASDARANSPAPDCLDFNQKPRAFVPIETSHDAAYFLRMEALEEDRSPDDE